MGYKNENVSGKKVYDFGFLSKFWGYFLGRGQEGFLCGKNVKY